MKPAQQSFCRLNLISFESAGYGTKPTQTPSQKPSQKPNARMTGGVIILPPGVIPNQSGVFMVYKKV
jgi:hypothetical protein